MLHLLAIAAEAGVPFELNEWDGIAARTPVIADLKPGGRYLACDLFEAGGTAALVRRLLAAEMHHRYRHRHRSQPVPRGSRAWASPPVRK